MRFETRELKPYAEPVSLSQLKKGSVYFALNYIDEAMLIPTMETVIYIGRDLEPGDSGQVYFQNIASYKRGVRYNKPRKHDAARFYIGSDREINHIFEYEKALEQLMACLLRRQTADKVGRGRRRQPGHDPAHDS